MNCRFCIHKQKKTNKKTPLEYFVISFVLKLFAFANLYVLKKICQVLLLIA